MRNTRRALLVSLLLTALTGLCGLTRPPATAPPIDPVLRVQFLGTGAAWPVPRLGCSCATCDAARTTSPRTRRLRSSLLLGTSPFLVVDIGPDIYRQLVDLPQPRPAAVLLTHTHQDHAGGVSDLHPLTQRLALPLLSAPPIWDDLLAESRFARSTFLFRDARAPVSVGAYSVRSFPLEHGTHSVGFRVEAQGHALGYVTDVDRVPDETLPALQNLDLMILDGTNVGDKHPSPAHISPDGIRALVARTHPKRLLFTHVGHAAPPHERLSADVRASYEAADVAYDGFTTQF